jgi:hypothetical protein
MYGLCFAHNSDILVTGLIQQLNNQLESHHESRRLAGAGRKRRVGRCR